MVPYNLIETSLDITAIYGKDHIAFGDVPFTQNKMADWGFKDLSVKGILNGLLGLEHSSL